MPLRTIGTGLSALGGGVARAAKKVTDVNTLRSVKKKASQAGLGKKIKRSRQRGNTISAIRQNLNQVHMGAGVDNAQQTVKRNLNRLKGFGQRTGRIDNKAVDNLLQQVDAGDANLENIADQGLGLLGNSTRMADLTDAKVGVGTLGYMGQRRLRGRTAVPRPEMLGGGRRDV